MKIEVFMVNVVLSLTALHPSTGAEAALLPHSHGAHEAAAVSSADSEEVLVWSFGSARSPSCPAAAQTHKEEGQGGALLETRPVPL